MLSSRSLKPVILGLAMLAAGCDRQSGDAAQPQASEAATASGGSEALTGSFDRSHKGSAVPDITVKDAAGKQLKLASLKGKPFLLNLWATWCAPCVAEMPMLDALASSGKLKVLTVNQDMGSSDKPATFFAGKGFKALEPWLDPENELSFHYGTGTLPTSVLYDANGREVWRLVGGHDWTTPETDKLLAEGQ